MEEITAQSGLFGGAVRSGAAIVDHTSLASNGRISRVALFFSKPAGCLKGIKAGFGSSPPTPGIIGNAVNATEHALKLEDGEVLVRAEYKADK
jgi:hypothetical protein